MALHRTLEAVRELAPAIAARSEEIECARRLPPSLVDQLKAAGCFRMLVPESHGGSAMTLAEHLEVIRELARADGSVGWATMIGSSAPVLLGGLPGATFDAVYSAGPDVVLAGAFNPTGVATPVDGGFRAAGRWSFASGCQHADWFLAHCMVDDGMIEGGMVAAGPMLAPRMMVVPAADVGILDTWSVSGLCGTGSHDFVLDGVFVSDEYTFSILEPGALEGPLGRIPELTYSSFEFANVALGIAEAALEEVTALATAKVPAFAEAALAANPLFRNQLGEADARLRAARALLDGDVASIWAAAVSGGELCPTRRGRARATATWAAVAAAAVVDTAYGAGGGRALYSGNPLQRRWRDVHAVTQHFALGLDTFTLAGALVAGQDVDLSFL